MKREAIFSPNPMRWELRWESHDQSVNYFNIVSCIIDIRLMIKQQRLFNLAIIG